MVCVTAYLTRGIQLILNTSKRAITERAEEMGNEDDIIPLSDIRQNINDTDATTLPSGTSTPGLYSGTNTPPSTLADDLASQLATPQRAQDPSRIRGTGGPPETPLHSPSILYTESQAPLPLTRPQRWAAFVNINFDRLTYGVLFLFVGLLIYYTTGYAMPAQ